MRQFPFSNMKLVALIRKILRELLEKIVANNLSKHDDNQFCRQKYADVMIRRVKEHDISEVTQLYESAFSLQGTKETLEMYFSSFPNTFFIAEKEGKIVGFIICKIELKIRRLRPQPIGCIVAIYVEPDCRRKGLGKKLFRLALDAVTYCGVSEIYLLADKKDTAASAGANLRIFKQAGFELEKSTGKTERYLMKLNRAER